MLRIWRRCDRLHILVGDNGIGMEQDELHKLKEQLRNEEDGYTGIGLGNVYKRIYAMYPGSSVEIYSRKWAGTVIEIEIPDH